MIALNLLLCVPHDRRLGLKHHRAGPIGVSWYTSTCSYSLQEPEMYVYPQKQSMGNKKRLLCWQCVTEHNRSRTALKASVNIETHTNYNRLPARQGYVNIMVWYVLYDDRFDNSLPNRHWAKFDHLTTVRDDNDVWLYHWTLSLHIQRVVLAGNIWMQTINAQVNY